MSESIHLYVDHLKSHDPSTRVYNAFIKHIHMAQLITSAMRVTTTTSSLIDHVLVNRQELYVQSGCLDV